MAASRSVTAIPTWSIAVNRSWVTRVSEVSQSLACGLVMPPASHVRQPCGMSGRSHAHRLTPMSALSRDDVAHLARLARIDLSDAELDRMVGELGVILESVAKVQEVAAEDIEPMSHPMPLTNVTRPDEVRPSLGAEAALAGAPASELQRFSVPRILSED